jgi:hypothetical protein
MDLLLGTVHRLSTFAKLTLILRVQPEKSRGEESLYRSSVLISPKRKAYFLRMKDSTPGKSTVFNAFGIIIVGPKG